MAIVDDIRAQRPDIAILSEAPPAERLRGLTEAFGAGWSTVWSEHPPGATYWYRLAVYSRWPVRSAGVVHVRNGVAMDVRVERPGRAVHILVVDGESRVMQLRTPFLEDIAEVCRNADRAGEPYDIVAGDFNAVSRSLGFDRVCSSGGGYVVASEASTDWRGTWPMPVPLYDIDHVCVGGSARVLGCTLFANRYCDHRGQLVRLAFDERPGDRSPVPRGPSDGRVRIRR
jgi:endonuclease/exonuclease/phosphatase family metal-dependent hydrolase